MEKEQKIKALAQFTKNPDLAIHTELVEIHDVLESLNEKEMPEMPEVSFEATNKLLTDLIEKVSQPCNTTIELRLI